MTILYAGNEFPAGVATTWLRQAGYESSDPALSLLTAEGTGPPPDGVDRISFADAPDGSGGRVVRLVLHKDDPTGLFSAQKLRSQVVYKILGATAALRTRRWYRFRYWLPTDFGPTGISRPLALWQLHQTTDGTNRTNTFTADAGADTLTFEPSVVWDDGQRIRLQTTGTLPGGLSPGNYWVVNPGASNTIQVKATQAGGVVDITSVGTGTHRGDEFTGVGPPLLADVRGSTVYLQRDTQVDEIAGRLYQYVASYPLVTGQVETITVCATWDWEPAGELLIWRNGRMICKVQNAPTTFNDAPARGGNGVYPVLCLYAPNGWGGGQDTRTAYYWDIEIGDEEYTTFNEFMAAVGSSDTELEGFVTRGVSL